MTRRGMSLIELLVAVAILGIVIAVSMNALLGFRALIELSNLKRTTHGNARQASLFLERDLRLAGYGIEPAFALDFSIYEGAGAYCGGSPGDPVTASPCPQQRDRIDGPDELVFYGRNPAYWGGDLSAPPQGRAWAVSTADASSVVLSAHGSEFFPRGQILQLVCSGGTTSVYVRLSTSTRVGAAGAVALPIEAAVAGDPFTQDPQPFVFACGGTARAFQVDRFRYFVDPDVVLADGTTAPFLLLDMGVDRNDDGAVDARDLIPIAQGIVDMQISYLRPEPVLAEVGATQNTPIAWCDEAARPITGPSTCAGGLRVVQFTAGTGAADYPSYTYLTPAAGAGIRRGPDAGNVAAIRIGLVARADRQGTALQTHPLLLNRSVLPPEDIDRSAVYATTEITVVTPNLQSRGLTFL